MTDDSSENSGEAEQLNKQKVSLGQLVKTTLAAAIGVQTEQNRKQDFESGSILPYIIAGIVFTSLFLFGIIVIVRIILRMAS